MPGCCALDGFDCFYCCSSLCRSFTIATTTASKITAVASSASSLSSTSSYKGKGGGSLDTPGGGSIVNVGILGAVERNSNCRMAGTVTSRAASTAVTGSTGRSARRGCTSLRLSPRGRLSTGMYGFVSLVQWYVHLEKMKGVLLRLLLHVRLWGLLWVLLLYFRVRLFAGVTVRGWMGVDLGMYTWGTEMRDMGWGMVPESEPEYTVDSASATSRAVGGTSTR